MMEILEMTIKNLSLSNRRNHGVNNTNSLKLTTNPSLSTLRQEQSGEINVIGNTC